MSYLIDSTGKRYTWGGQSVTFPSWNIATSTLLNGIISYWKMDEPSISKWVAVDSLGLNDASIFPHDTQLWNDNSINSGVTGKISTAYSFKLYDLPIGPVNASVGLYVRNASINVKTGGSLSAWINHSYTGYQGGIIAGSWDQNALTNGYGIRFTSGAADNFKLYGEIADSTRQTINTSTNIIANTWWHTVLTWESSGGTLNLYTNGVLDASAYQNTNVAYTSTEFFIGKSRSIWTPSGFNGIIDEVGVWNRALTPVEVSTLYNNGVGKTYPFDTIYTLDYQRVYNAFSTKPDAAVATAQNTMVKSLKDGGVWDKLDLFYVFANNASDNALKNWKNPGTYDCSILGSPKTLAFTALEGYDGSTNAYLTTQWNPSINGVNYTLNSACLGTYTMLDINLNQAAMGTYDTTDVPIWNFITPRYAGNFYGSINSSISSTGATVANSLGMSILCRPDSSTVSFFRNGVDLGDAVNWAVRKPNTSLYIFERNPIDPRRSANRISCTFVGGNLSNADVSLLTSAFSIYMISNNKSLELSPNVNFDSSLTGWSQTGSNWAWETDGIGGGRARHTVGVANSLYANIGLVPFNRYRFIYTVGDVSEGGTIQVRASSESGGYGTIRSSAGTYTEDLTVPAAGNSIAYFTPNASFNGYIDSISIKQI